MAKDVNSLIASIFGPSVPRPKKKILDLSEPPSADARAGRMSGEASNYKRTWGDTGSDVEAILRDIATAQPEALMKAFEEPGIGTATNAAAQTALMFGQPVKAMGAVGAGLVGSVAKDTDLFGLLGDATADEAPADDPLLPDQRTRLKQLQDKQAKGKMLTRAERQEQDSYLGTLKEAATAKSLAQTRLNEEASRAKQQEYDEAVDYAGKVRDEALAKDYRFQDTELGKTWNEISGVAPFAAAYGAGALTRLGTGPGKDVAGKVMKDYVLPIVSGTGAAFAAQNVPLFGNMGAPANNPQKEAFMAYARELPEGHPRKQEMRTYAQSLPDENPVQSEAYEQFNDGLWKRLGVAGLEGVTFGKLGASTVNVGGRAWDAATGRNVPASGPSNSPPTGPSQTPPPGPGTAPGRNSASYRTYADLPPSGRQAARDAYVSDRAVQGGAPPARATAQEIKNAFASQGINVPVTPERIKATNQAVARFVQQEGREPSGPADWSKIFNDKTLMLALTAGGGAAAMSDPELEALLSEILGGGR